MGYLLTVCICMYGMYVHKCAGTGTTFASSASSVLVRFIPPSSRRARPGSACACMPRGSVCVREHAWMEHACFMLNQARLNKTDDGWMLAYPGDPWGYRYDNVGYVRYSSYYIRLS